MLKKIAGKIILILRIIFVIFGLFAAGVLFAGAFIYSAPVWRGPLTDNFNGKVFMNSHVDKRGFGSFLKLLFTDTRGEWPEWVEIKPQKPYQRADNEDGLIITFINHTTFLLQWPDLNIITDPMFSYRASPVSFAGPARVHNPGISIEDIPPIDVVLLSHNHYDHADEYSLKYLKDKFNPLFITTLGNKLFLNNLGIDNVVEMDWWDENSDENMNITCVPSRHFSGRGLLDRNKTLWAGFHLKVNDDKILFIGDTGMDDSIFWDIKDKLGSTDISLLPIGAYMPQHFMGPVHINPEEALVAHMILGSKTSIGSHLECFPLAFDSYEQPRQDLKKALKKYNKPSKEFIIAIPGLPMKLEENGLNTSFLNSNKN